MEGLNNAGVFDFKTARLVWVKNTLDLKFIKISEALLTEGQANKTLKVLSGPFAFSFDEGQNLPFGTFPR